jgi:hypothetical protein
MFIGASMRKTSFFFLLIEKQVIEEAEEKKGEKKERFLFRLLSRSLPVSPTVNTLTQCSS